jgi:membrane-associated phospholipid phosphatase
MRQMDFLSPPRGGVLRFCTVFFMLAIAAAGYAETPKDEEPSSRLSVLKVFDNVGWNFLNIVKYNYGANFLLTVPLTYALVESGADWGWYKVVYGKRGLALAGAAVNVIGYGVPVLFPIAAYVSGAVAGDRKAQVLGLAAAQAAFFSSAISASLKLAAGRRQAGVYDLDPQTSDYSKDFRWNTSAGIIDGWPSGHTANAMAQAVVIAEIYKDNFLVKALSYLYVGFIGVGMTMCDHWVSDIAAGALIGYAIGKVVGKNFSRMLSSPPESEEHALSFYFSPTSVGIVYRW